ncbi:unnamed protein product [Cuscuta epithymum]|uniref:Uncharacterized protein n=1 Tax=Cuscuta epithymum TaxID=186058 RepID=A0AAV0DXJ6_9ASTE|nr:unnamed protein product [Cuscuta epithymum]
MYLNCLPFLSEINFNGSTMGGQTLGDVSLTPSIISLPAIYLLRIPISHYSFHVHSSSFDCKLGVFSSGQETMLYFIPYLVSCSSSSHFESANRLPYTLF